jgi:hypothetical protein
VHGRSPPCTKRHTHRRLDTEPRSSTAGCTGQGPHGCSLHELHTPAYGDGDLPLRGGICPVSWLPCKRTCLYPRQWAGERRQGAWLQHHQAQGASVCTMHWQALRARTAGSGWRQGCWVWGLKDCWSPSSVCCLQNTRGHVVHTHTHTHTHTQLVRDHDTLHDSRAKNSQWQGDGLRDGGGYGDEGLTQGQSRR